VHRVTDRCRRRRPPPRRERASRAAP
jgi:hypothetical protein